MKKLGIILISSILLGTFLSGCEEKKIEVKNNKQESIASSESIDSNEKQTKTESINEAEGDNSEKNENTEASQNNISNDNNDKSNNNSQDEFIDENTTETNFGSYSNDEEDITQTAAELHQKSCETQWKYLFGCPYQLDYDDMSGEAVRITDVNSLSEIIDEYCKVFAGDGSVLNEKYFEKDGKVYCYDGSRGANIYYKGTELILVSSDESSALFTAASHYADPETDDPMDSKSYDFKMIKEDGVWKTAVFTLPY